MICLACAAPAVWLIDSAASGLDMVNGACGEHVNKVLTSLAVHGDSPDVLVTRVPRRSCNWPSGQHSTPSGRCTRCGQDVA